MAQRFALPRLDEIGGVVPKFDQLSADSMALERRMRSLTLCVIAWEFSPTRAVRLANAGRKMGGRAG